MEWRTAVYRWLDEPLSKLLGDKTAKAFLPLRVRTVGDLMRHVPRRYVSGTDYSDLRELEVGEDAAVLARVAQMNRAGQEPRMRLEVVLTDGRSELQATFFGRKRLVEYWQRQLSLSDRGIFVGRVGEFRNHLQLVHPDFVMIDGAGEIVGSAKEDRRTMARQVSRGGLVGLYPQTSTLPTWTISQCIDLVLDQMGELPEPLPHWVLDEADVPQLLPALRMVHAAESRADADRGLQRLRFDEALGLQLAMARRRMDAARQRAPALTGQGGGLLEQFDAQLPYVLTEGQVAIGEQVFADIARDQPMQRLLQGEVGSGKTVVALRAMVRAVDSGYQAVLLAPTEVLAAQHADTIAALMGDLAGGQVLGAPADATEVVLLTGSMPAAARKAALLSVASGTAGIVIGTHAVLGDQVQFADLGLVVIDEQHRFGVEQRARLADRAELRPHVLVMTATPIPRSVAMTVFGDLEVSTLTEIPAGRAAVQTTVVNVREHPTWLDRAWQRVVEEVTQGRQVFIVCPRISESETEKASGAPGDDDGPGDVENLPPPATVADTYALVTGGPLADLRVGMLHGRMPSSDKDAVMGAFAAGELDVLVATTVIEVGVDVPNASMMVVLDADRFGISQLHQLRGRIGRGAHPGLCLLTSQAEAGSPTAQRVATVASTRDGFVLAEADLVARREGNVLGARQAGTRSTLRLLRVLEHADLIAQARDIADRLVAECAPGEHAGVDDMVAQTEQFAAGEWLERS